MMTQKREGLLDTNLSGQKSHQELLKLLVSIQEDERLRISRDLHDETGQTLTALSMVLGMIQSKLPYESIDLHAWLKTAIELTQSASTQLHAVIQDLRPPALDVLGLKPALEELCHIFQGYTGIAIDAQVSELPDLPEYYGITFYRCLQEALSNVARHAQARQIWVTLSLDPPHWVLSVKDDGIGMDGAEDHGAGSTRPFGLAGLQERLQMLGGSLEIDSRLGQGTQLFIRLPEPDLRPNPLEQTPGASS